MIKVSQNYNLPSTLCQQLADQFRELISEELISEKIIQMPISVADGFFFYTAVISGLSVIVWDLLAKEPILIRKLRGNENLQIIQYDLNNHKNFIHVKGIKFSIDDDSNLGLGVFNNNIQSTFQPVVNERFFVVQLLVDRDLFDFSNENKFIINSDDFKIKQGKNIHFFDDHIDSESRVIINVFKNKSFLDPGFEIYVRGVALRLLSNFISHYSDKKSLFFTSAKDMEGLNIAEKYLLENLATKFPGLHFLADIACMSVSKYMALFKKKYACTPNDFYMKEKLSLANKLLQSGKFESVAIILKELKFTKSKDFSAKYFQQFGRSPFTDFVKISL